MKCIFLASLLFCLGVHAAEIPGIHSIDVDPVNGNARAVVVDRAPLAHTTQILPLDDKGNVMGGTNVSAQFEAVLSKMNGALSLAGSDWKHIVKINVYAANNEVVASVQNLLGAFTKRSAAPAITYVISKLPHPDALLAMDAIGVSTTGVAEVQRSHRFNPAGATFADVAVLPTNGVVYISGQAQKGALADASANTLAQLQQTLDFLKLDKKDIVFAKAFVQPATDAKIVNEQFAKFFQGQLVPPLALVDWTSGKDLPIEIEMVVSAHGTGAKETNTVTYLCPPFMQPSPVYSKIARVNSGKLVYLSGLLGKSTNNAEAEIHEIFADLKEISKKAGSDMDHLVKATYYVSNPQTSGKLNDIRPKYYNPKTPPAASKASVKGNGFAGKGITFDMIAVTAE